MGFGGAEPVPAGGWGVRRWPRFPRRPRCRTAPRRVLLRAARAGSRATPLHILLPSPGRYRNKSLPTAPRIAAAAQALLTARGAAEPGAGGAARGGSARRWTVALAQGGMGPDCTGSLGQINLRNAAISFCFSYLSLFCRRWGEPGRDAAWHSPLAVTPAGGDCPRPSPRHVPARGWARDPSAPRGISRCTRPAAVGPRESPGRERWRPPPDAAPW